MSDQYIIHIVDDEEAVRHSLVFLLSAFGFPSQTHASATAFLSLSDKLKNACLVTDFRMPDMTGLDLLKALRARGHAMPVIIITGHGDIQTAVAAMKAGASDFIEKPFAEDVLINTIKTVSTEAQNHALATEQNEAARSKLDMLSPRERQVLEGVVSGSPNKIIAHTLGLSPRTVEVYRANIMAKMQVRTLADLVRVSVRGNLDA